MSRISEDLLIGNWYSRIKPFDMMVCGACLSMHYNGCDRIPEHKEVVAAVRKAKLCEPTDGEFKRLYPAFLQLRKRFAKFYPKRSR